VLTAQSAAALPSGRPVGFLTDPSPGDPLDIARQYLETNRAALGLKDADLADSILTDRYTTRHNGLTHLYWRQRLAGIEVLGGDLNVSVTTEGRMIGLYNRFVPGLGRVANTRVPAISAIAAVRAAATDLGLAITEPLATQQTKGGPAREVLLSDGGISLDSIPVKLMYLPDGEGGARLVWNLFLRLRDQQHWWNVSVDAVTGEVLLKVDWILKDGYRVFALPKENPDDGARTLEVDPADPNASPFGWHDTDGTPGAELTDTRGNNVSAQEDADADNSGGFRPDGGGALSFDFPLDLAQPPVASQSAAIANLFYWNNILHDIHYRYGFDEVSGNFQVDNYGRGGTGGDPVRADAQDGSGLNNANFSRAPDGSSPRMQMFLFEYPGVTVHSPASIAQSVGAGPAQFGPALTPTGITGDVVQALDVADANGPSTTDGCSSLINDPNEIVGRVALIDRGTCTFVEKVANAQAAGAIAAIVVNHEGDEVITMGGTDPSISIQSALIGQSHGDSIKGELAGTVNATLSSEVLRDASLDDGIVVHEYGHGVSIRLSGGPSNVGCLSLKQSAGMGEGWSDWWTLTFTTTASDTPLGARPIGTYAHADIDGTNRPHGVGEIWALALWEIYWNLVGAYGFDPDLYAGTGGNNLALQLVMDGLKIQGCEPTFLAARDAILQADLVSNDGANQCLLWQGFAKRGMGVNADDKGNPRLVKVTEDFSVPPGCEISCGNGRIDSGEQCDDENVLDGDCCSPLCRFEVEDSPCDDADACSENDTCDGSGGCQGGPPLVCDDADVCTDDACDPGTGCVFLDNTAPCDDGSACSTLDTCSAGTCQGGPPLVCDDADVCTDDACDPGSGCVFLDNTAPCDDGSACTTLDTCSAGTCQGGPPLVCDDADVCTDDACDPGSGCVNEAIAGCTPPIPAVSSRGRIFLALLLLVGGAALQARRSQALR
jgi:cysteine-rich repeat protein